MTDMASENRFTRKDINIINRVISDCDTTTVFIMRIEPVGI